MPAYKANQILTPDELKEVLVAHQAKSKQIFDQFHNHELINIKLERHRKTRLTEQNKV